MTTAHTTNTPLVKICGLSTPETLNAAIEHKADFIGLVFFPNSPRNVSILKAKELANPAPKGVRTVALTVNPDKTLLDSITASVNIDMLQLHGSETPDRIAEIKDKYGLPIIKAFNIATLQDLEPVASYESCVDWFLFDAKSKNATLPGGNGESFDWSILSGKRWSKPWMLSGGLNEHNITDALNILHPDAVDVSSGVETAKGVKDIKKIENFIKLIKEK